MAEPKKKYKQRAPLNPEIRKAGFIAKAKVEHGDRYDYSLVDFTEQYGKRARVNIVCKEHGTFEQSVSNHLFGFGCEKCSRAKRGLSRRTPEESFISRAREKHGNKYDYSLVEYKTNRDKVVILCPKHGAFLQTPANHTNGGCFKCGADLRRGPAISTETFIQKAREVHGDVYGYENSVYTSVHDPIEIVCPTHGAYTQTPANHINHKRGCWQCAVDYRATVKKHTTEQFVDLLKDVHGDKYDYSKLNYTGSHDQITVGCKKHGEFSQLATNHLAGQGCPACGCSGVSKGEGEVKDFLESLGLDIEQSNRSIIGPKEIDCVIHSHKLGVEYHGLVYHSDMYARGKDYHKEKLKAAEASGFSLLQIFEDEWQTKRPIVESVILGKLGMLPERKYARKCEVREISTKEAKEFLNSNHLQGFVTAEVQLGLWEKGTNALLMVATFSENRSFLFKKEEGTYELVRLASKVGNQIVGGFSKLLKYFIGARAPKKIKTFCDLRYFTGSGYLKVGFKKVRETKPNYYYTNRGKSRLTRHRFQKHKLPGILEIFDPTKTEAENMRDNGYYRIYDCGNAVFEMTPE